MGSIEYVTHASLLFRQGELALLTDPFYWFDGVMATVMTHFPPRSLEPSDFGPLQFLFSSHVHPDHSHPATLRRLRPQVRTVLLPAERPVLEGRYRTAGYDDIRLLDNGQTHELTPTLRVTCYWSDAIDTCLVVDMDGKVAVHFNDCLPTLELVELLARRHRIDYAFVLYTSAQELFPFLLPRSEARLQELSKQREDEFVALQLDRLRRLRPRTVIPYSMTMTWYQPEQRQQNAYHRRLPCEFAAEVRSALPEVRCEVVQPGDSLDTGSGSVTRHSSDYGWGTTMAEYLDNLGRYVDQTPSLRPFSYGTVSALEQPLHTHLEEFVRRRPPDKVAPLYRFLRRGVSLQVVGDDGQATFMVDFLTRRVARTRTGLPVVEIEAPASIVAPLLDGYEDPYSLLFMHRTRFKLNSFVSMDDEAEAGLYMMTFMVLLCDNPFDWIAAEAAARLPE